MKKLIVAALLMVGMTTFAQEGKPMRNADQRDQMTPEQRNQLQLKKLTYELGLDANQQAEMARIITERSAKREALTEAMKAKGEKPTADERFNRQNEMLDYNIAEKAKIQKLLSKEQFAKWEQMKEKRSEKIKLANDGKRKAKSENPQK